jgi:hypothetical protein
MLVLSWIAVFMGVNRDLYVLPIEPAKRSTLFQSIRVPLKDLIDYVKRVTHIKQPIPYTSTKII